MSLLAGHEKNQQFKEVLRKHIYLQSRQSLHFFLYKRFYQCVSGFSVTAIGYFLFFATEVGSMKYKMEGKNRVH